ncbi:hypothetical protein DNTS_034208 [Danionella cerebrum]|uniref:CLOCK-interacting pacemaker a n=1 Tax=Danionella cerebrum TaxID=2873325 RepID=A0A553MYV7_9TELE|nr:hypothetical protein DNTS_034208 [Danionella translucida]
MSQHCAHRRQEKRHFLKNCSCLIFQGFASPLFNPVPCISLRPGLDTWTEIQVIPIPPSSNMGNKRKASSETDKDSDASSGYFSALDQTDFEDVGSSGTHRIPKASRVPCIPATSSMVVMNNLLLKQPNDVAPALKPWNFNSPLDMSPQSQLLYLQPVFSTGDSSGQSFDAQKHSRRHGTFPKIASNLAQGSSIKQTLSSNIKNSNHRHQLDDPDEKPVLNFSLKPDLPESFYGYGVDPNAASLGETSNVDGELGVEHSSSREADLQEPHTTTSPFSPSTDSFFTAFSQKCTKASIMMNSDVEDIPEGLSPSSSKHKRFCNTYNILNRSGLLGITMRTKELIRQNKRSQAQLQSLQAQTDLFLEAICSRDPKVWTRLQLVLQNSGNVEEMPDSLVGSVRAVKEDVLDVGCAV